MFLLDGLRRRRLRGSVRWQDRPWVPLSRHLEILIRKHAGVGAEGLMEKILEDLYRFKGTAPQADDITLLVLRALPEGEG